MERIPLFPLNTVLFPHAPLPLHIFEQRYRDMIGRCIDEQSPFGVVLIRSGLEVGGLAEPFDIGTTARISRVQRLPDGRMNLVAIGRSRFRIHALDASRPHLEGDVEPIESEEAGTFEARDLAARVAALYGEQVRLKLCSTGQWQRVVSMPDEPDVLADVVASQLDTTPEAKQQLLETLSVPERLRREADILGDLIRNLGERWDETRELKYAGAALN
jgi:Lon protease-like protein